MLQRQTIISLMEVLLRSTVRRLVNEKLYGLPAPSWAVSTCWSSMNGHKHACLLTAADNCFLNGYH